MRPRVKRIKNKPKLLISPPNTGKVRLNSLLPATFFTHPFVGWNFRVAHRHRASSIWNIVPVIVVHQWELHITHPVIHPTW